MKYVITNSIFYSIKTIYHTANFIIPSCKHTNAPMPRQRCGGEIMCMDYTTDHVGVCEPATETSTTFEKDMDRPGKPTFISYRFNVETLAVKTNQTESQHGTGELKTNQNTPTRPAGWTLTISLSREITLPKQTAWAQAKSEAASKVSCGTKWTPCCRQTGEKQEKRRPEILAEHLWTENPTQKHKSATKV